MARGLSPESPGRRVLMIFLVYCIVSLFFMRLSNKHCVISVLLWISSRCNVIIITRRVRPPNGGRNEAAPAPRPAPAPARWLYVTMGYTNVVAVTLLRKCGFSPNCWGTGGGWGWGGNGHLLEAYSTKPTCKPKSTMCSFWDLRRYAVVVVVAVAAVAGRGKLMNVK